MNVNVLPIHAGLKFDRDYVISRAWCMIILQAMISMLHYFIAFL